MGQWLDWLQTGLPGQIGMTKAPGQQRPLAEDLKLLVDSKCHVLVTLLKDYPHDTSRLRSDLLKHVTGNSLDRVREAGMESLWFQVPDLEPPESMVDAQALVSQILLRCRDGKNVVLHCLAGQGRTGTLAACCLVALGWPAVPAIAHVRHVREGTIHNSRQEGFVVAFHQFLMKPNIEAANRIIEQTK